MKKIWGYLTRRWPIAILLICLLLSSGCGLFKSQPTTTLTVLPADRVIKSLPDGNYEVTPAWLQDRYTYERTITQQLDDCKESGGNAK